MGIDKIIINKNIFRYGQLTWEISSVEEIDNILNIILQEHLYNIIHVYKRVPGSHKPAIKTCMFFDETGEKDLLIICDKQYLNIVKDSLKGFGLDYSKPNGGINKKVLK